MVKVGTRRLIGNVLVWGGLATVFITHAFFLYQKLMTTHAYINLSAGAAILIGLLWAWRKK